MIWTIAKREFLEYLKSVRFLIGFLITLALVTLCTIINANDFQQRQQDYLSAQQEMKSDAFYVRVYRPPEILSIFAQGKDRQLGNRLEMTYTYLPARTSGYMGQQASQHNRYVGGFSSVDYAFVVRVLLSLLVIFLTYDSVSGEKSRGTLRLVFANSLPRHVLLMGKVIGVLTIVFISLFVATIVCLLILQLGSSVSMENVEWARILSMFGVSFLYLICFLALGLFVSVVSNRPSIALTVLLQTWIFICIIYPNLALVVADNIYALPSEEEIVHRKKAAFQPFENDLKQTQQEFNKAVGSAIPVPDELELREIDLSAKQAESNHQVDVEVGNQFSHQVALAQAFSILSPASLYDQALLRYARTGMEEYEGFMDAVDRYWQHHVDLQKSFVRHPDKRRKVGLPAFGFVPETQSESLLATVPQILVISLFGAIFFMLAHMRFLKKDLR